MVDPLAMTVATNVATKIADTLTEQAQQAVAAIVRRIREKFRSPSAASAEVATLDAAVLAGDAATVEALARKLEQLFAADPQFRDEIQALWDSAHADNSVTNIFHGKADKVIMMRDVHGDLTIN